METAKVSDYTVRITQANKSELVVVVYDVILDSMREGIEAFNSNDMEGFIDKVRYGQKFLLELMNTLDFKYDLSKELLRLYIFVNKQMINSTIKKDASLLDSAIDVMEKLKEGFVGVAASDDSAPVMENVQPVYAGLTYGRGTLNEISYGTDVSTRGFKA